MAYLLRLLINLFRTLWLPFWLFRRWSWSRGKPRWIRLEIKPRLVPFRSAGSALSRLTESARDHNTSLEGVRELTRKAARDPMIRGLVLSLPPLEAGWAACKDLREIVAQLRAAGKSVVCYLPQGGGNRELYVALAADRIYIAPYASLGPLGLAITPLYVRPLLDRLGIRLQAHSTGEYKSAAEPLLRESMSDAAREQLDALMAIKHRALLDALQQARGLSETEVAELLRESLILAEDALARRVVDGVKYEDELPSALNESTTATAPKPLSAARYLRLQRPLWIRLSRPATIAVVPLHGTISGESPSGLGAGLRHSALAPLLRNLAENPQVRAIVLHIDSPGGSALASELMHRDIKQLTQKKPVVACFGEVAASGGYYLACACNKIVAQDLCTTGSIGVVTAKVDAQDFIDRIGLRPQFLRTAESADMFSPARPLSGHEQKLISAHIAALYKRFLTVAAEGRGRSTEAIDSVARGRVWSGGAAKDHGLVDAIGGVERALEEARMLVPELSPAQRAALEPQLHRVKSGRRFGLRALLFGAWLQTQRRFLQELIGLYELRREAALYYAPLD